MGATINFLGIDPGKRGALVILNCEWHGKNVIEVVYSEMLNAINGNIFLTLLEQYNPFCTIEEPTESGYKYQTSAIKLNKNYKMWEVYITDHAPNGFKRVNPLTWKKAVIGNISKDKRYARVACEQLFPRQYLRKGKELGNDGKRDAALIAWYGACINQEHWRK